MEDNNMNKNQIAAQKLANNVTTNNMDSVLKRLEEHLMNKPFLTTTDTAPERSIFCEGFEEICETLTIMCSGPNEDNLIVCNSIPQYAYYHLDDAKNEPECFLPINFVDIIKKNWDVLKGEPCTYEALISLCHIMSLYDDAFTEFAELFELTLSSINFDNSLTSSMYLNAVSKIYYDNARFPQDDPSKLLFLTKFMRNKQTDTPPLIGDEPLLSELIHNMFELATNIECINIEKASFLFDLYECLIRDPSNCPVISIYDAIINCWELASKYVFTYDILFVLIFLKNNWKFTNDEMNTLEVLVHSINTPTLN